MTDSMNFGPEWLRNLSSEGTTSGISGGGVRQLAEYRYSREDMLALFDKNLRPPGSLSQFATLFSEQVLSPLALLPAGEEERPWATRAPPMGVPRGRGGSLERGRGGRGRGTYPTFGRSGGFETGGGWGNNGEQSDWSPRKEYANHINRSASVDNWRRTRDDDEGWRNSQSRNANNEKWGRSTSWRDESGEERGGERTHTWHDNGHRSHPQRRMWETEDHLPEWATEHLSEGGGTFDASGAFHGSDEEQLQDSKGALSSSVKKDSPLQKSISHHNITYKSHAPVLASSQSATSLSKPSDSSEKSDLSIGDKDEEVMVKDKPKPNVHSTENNNGRKDTNPPDSPSALNNQESSVQKDASSGINGLAHDPGVNNRAVDEFDRITEDLVIKLVDEPSKTTQSSNTNLPNTGPVQPPPNLTVPPIQDKWFYQDPQGDLQGPFTSTEMTEWLKAGYFLPTLLVKRHCDDRFYSLGELMAATGANPFQSHVRFPLIKPEVHKMPEQDMLQMQFMQQQAQQAQFSMRQAPDAFGQGEPWASLNALQHREILARQLANHGPIGNSDLQFLQQQQQTNSFMNLINQIQADKIQTQVLQDKAPPQMSQMNPLQQLVQQMGGMQMHNRIPPGAGPSLNPTQGIAGPAGLAGLSVPGGLAGLGAAAGQRLPSAGLQGSVIPGSVISSTGLSSVLPGSSITGLGHPGNLQGDTLTNTLPTMHSSISGGGLTQGSAGLSGLTGSLVGQTSMSTGISKNNPIGGVDPMVGSDGHINNLLRQLQNKQVPQIESLWQQNQYMAVPPQQSQQWQQTDAPISMWDVKNPTPPPSTISSSNSTTSLKLPQQPSSNQASEPAGQSSAKEDAAKTQKAQKEKNKEAATKEDKKRKEAEEKQAKKEAEEKRKQEQRKQELEKKAAEEKKKKEEERIKKELEKARKEAEEKRLRELEEKRKQKELRKLEEENRKKAEELRKLEDDERERREQKMREEQERRQAEESRKAHENSNRVAKAAPWSLNTNTGPSLEEVQKAERQRKAEQVALLQQQKIQQQQEQPISEKPSSMQLCWANKPMKPRQVKSLDQIQAEEQEMLSKQMQESRIAQLQKEKELAHNPLVPTIWTGQNLNWNTNASQWSNSGGFWDDAVTQKPPTTTVKPSSLPKSNSSSAIPIGKVQPQLNKPQPQAQNKTKQPPKKEQPEATKNGPVDEFTSWCTKALTNMKTTVDIPTFISLLRDIESAYDVKEICRDYLGDGMQTNQFATQFLEKRRSFKPKTTTQKDDMCSPAPAITPSIQHNSDFQEVKSNRKRTKKSKMLKVDARILGFSVTAAQDRINVGDRDYVDTA